LEIIVSNHLGHSRRERLAVYMTFAPSGLLGPLTVRNYKKQN